CCKSAWLDPEVVRMYNHQVADIRGLKTLSPEARSLLLVGAEKFMVIRFDETGEFESVRSNSSCAAGTGSFLDQQAFRLNLSGIEELCETAQRNNDSVPDIASRCSVFAKTDLIHAQQRGYSLAAICDSLCKGLAKNIVDTLFNQEPPLSPIFFTGGVSRNAAVIRHLEQQLGIPLQVHEHSHLMGALGACYLWLEENPISTGKWQSPSGNSRISSLDEILLPDHHKKSYYHPPLKLKLSDYPDFSSENSWNFRSVAGTHPADVQVDLYLRPAVIHEAEAFLGIDIGSTSTKAILIDNEAIPLAGFYTYTAGKPIEAVKLIFEAIDDLTKREHIRILFKGAGTTGSGRNFIGKIIQADLIIDEITTHAKAAYTLNPKTDTIIEIGGQDSKFTLMQDGIVTFSQMNSVCAAGTGSFIEEQARKLNCPLPHYARRTDGVAAPLASDRCTVFMERDTNQLLNEGYTADEILATTLHSVMENYLKKVGIEGSIGDHVCFQGATAKNRSLVAAFEQRIGKKIFVSPYCHLTGALGVALMLCEEPPAKTGFRGIGLYQESIRIHSETCTLCTNHCHISLTTIQGEEVAYGFLCGRDYATKKHVDPASTVFNLMKERTRVLRTPPGRSPVDATTIGLPATLHLFDDLLLWKRFFENLSLRVITSEQYLDPLKEGKRIAGAEFCAPIDSMYGHVAYLAERADFIFFPISFETRNKAEGSDRYFCYYTQFSASLVTSLKDKRIPGKMISPLLNFMKGNRYIVRQLTEALSPFLGSVSSSGKVKAAYEEALRFSNSQKRELGSLFKRSFKQDTPVSVLLLGRPYVVLAKSMNKGIPEIFARMGTDAFYQDMIKPEEVAPGENETLLQAIPWYYAASILETARLAAATPNLYPVLITAFKCAPDAFILDYFKKLMNQYKKPYLILQIDEHDSNVGYETRIEAAIRAFRNHASMNRKAPDVASLQLLPHLETQINGKTLLFPSWDNLVAPLLVANLKRSGIDARLLQSSELSIKKSMVYNTGQCLPVNIVAQDFIDYVEKNHLKPENTMLWMTKCYITCNLRLYPFYIKNFLEAYGHGFEHAAVYSGQLSHLEIAVGTSYYAYFAYLLGGLIRKLGCKIRPYEIHQGETDEVTGKSLLILEVAFLGKRQIDSTVKDVIRMFDRIERKIEKRPGVAIFGDLYVRDNDIMNQQLIRTIEACGGEVITTPYTDLVKINIENIIRRAMARGDYFESGLYRVMLASIKRMEDKYYKLFEKYLGPKPVVNPLRLEKHLSKFNISPFHSGESFENILKIFYILENYPSISLFVQTNPAFCCPALVTEAMTQEIKRVTGIPVVTLTYDGTSENKNDIIIPYLQN
ncbi:MAG: hypothetical protein JXA23_09195, partial [Bacteroidales bacterium]|nr:hypothetical protein [Bacteroidales bacterium]